MICTRFQNWQNSLFAFYFQNLSGTIVALINVLCISISPNPRTAAIYYFITALFMLLACFDTYFALPLNVSKTLFICIYKTLITKSNEDGHNNKVQNHIDISYLYFFWIFATKMDYNPHKNVKDGFLLFDLIL